LKGNIMKKFALGIIIVGLASALFAHSTNKPHHRVIFEVSVDGPEKWEAILNNVENLQKAFGSDQTQIEVVGHGKGLGLLRKTNDTLASRMEKIAGTGVVFAACQNTMRKMNVTKEELLPFVTTVDSGVAEVVRRQEQGWSYIKAGS